MGSDNLETLHKWKNYELILANYSIIVYNRRGAEKNPFPKNKNVQFLNFPFLDISATFIRENIKKGISMQYFLPEPAWKYIDETKLYSK